MSRGKQSPLKKFLTLGAQNGRESLKNFTFVESFVDFTPEQTQAWTELANSLRAGSASIGQTCTELDSLTIPESAPDKLALVETMAH